MTVRWNGEAAKAAAREGGIAGLHKWADDLLAASQPLVPVAAKGGGFLRDSGRAQVDEFALRAAVSYDSPPGTHLAIWVHEVMIYQHPVGQPKFLEMPLVASQMSGPHALADAIRARLI
jgi:hypothetical protein